MPRAEPRSCSRWPLTVLLSGACADFDDVYPPDCDDEEDATPALSVVSPSSNAPVGESVVLHGSLTTSTRVREFHIGGVPVTGLATNFSHWTVEIARSDAEAYRTGAFAMLPIELAGACGALEHEADPVVVRLDPSAEGLAIDIELPSGACEFIPHDGEQHVDVHVRASAADVGLAVEVGATVGVIAGSTPVILQAVDGAAAHTVRLLGDGEGTGHAYVTATAGGARAVSAESVLIAAGPAFGVASLAIEPGGAGTAHVSTRAVLSSCVLLASAPGIAATVVTADDEVELAATASTIPPPPSCGQTALVHVSVADTVGVGSGAIVSCVDTYARMATLTLDVVEGS